MLPEKLCHRPSSFLSAPGTQPSARIFFVTAQQGKKAHSCTRIADPRKALGESEALQGPAWHCKIKNTPDGQHQTRGTARGRPARARQSLKHRGVTRFWSQPNRKARQRGDKSCPPRELFSSGPEKLRIDGTRPRALAAVPSVRKALKTNRPSLGNPPYTFADFFSPG